MTTRADPSASSGSTASPGSTVFAPRVQTSIRVVADATFDHVDTNEDVRFSAYPTEVLSEAKERYAKFFEKKVEDVTGELIERTSLSVPGWLVANVRDWRDVATGAVNTSSCG